jgi:hypothetical protein
VVASVIVGPGAFTTTTVSHSLAGATRALAAPVRPLPIPNPLTRDWTAPAGRFAMPKQVNVVGTATVDLSAATISGSSGYLFLVAADGTQLTILGGQVNGRIDGLVRDSVRDGSTADVTISGTAVQGARSLVYAPAAGGPINVRLDHVTSHGLGDGIRATANGIDVTSSTLTGGGAPPSGYPAGIHSLDDRAGNVAVPASYINVSDSIITGFTSQSFQGDSIIGETRVASALIERNVLGHNTDSGGVDSKIAHAVVTDNTIYSDGDRALASHFGTLVSSGNTIYQSARSASGDRGKAYQGSGTLVATDDTVTLMPGAYLAQSVVVLVPGTGPPSTYPRYGNLTLTHITDENGNPISGPCAVPSKAGHRPDLKVSL